MKNKKRNKFLNWFKTGPGISEPQKLNEKLKDGIEVVRQRPSIILPTLENFNNAVVSATSEDFQDRQMLFDFYWQALTLDPWIKAVMEKRFEAITERQVVLYQDDVEREDLSGFFKSPKFKNFLKDILLTKFYGFQVFEFEVDDLREQKWFDYRTVPHINFNPYKKEVLKKPQDMTGKKMSEFENILFFGDKRNLGDLLQIAKLYIEFNAGKTFRLRYAELASENFIIEKHKEYNPTLLDESKNAWENRGPGSLLQVPEGTNIETHNQSSSQQNQLFKDLVDDYKKEISTLILGQTMTTQDGSSRSQAEVHSEEQNNKFNADIQFIEDFLNYEFSEFIKLWIDIPADKVTFKLETTNTVKLSKKVDIMKQLKDLGAEFTSDEIKEQFKDLIDG